MAKIQKSKMFMLVSGLDVKSPLHYGSREPLIPGKPVRVSEDSLAALKAQVGFQNLIEDRANGKGPMIKIINPVDAAPKAKPEQDEEAE